MRGYNDFYFKKSDKKTFFLSSVSLLCDPILTLYHKVWQADKTSSCFFYCRLKKMHKSF